MNITFNGAYNVSKSRNSIVDFISHASMYFTDNWYIKLMCNLNAFSAHMAQTYTSIIISSTC